jgi:hypothetical protein
MLVGRILWAHRMTSVFPGISSVKASLFLATSP